MTLCFLKPVGLSIPDNIEVLEDFGVESVFSNDKCVADGNVLLIEGKCEDIISWLGGHEIWVGNGLSGFTKEKIKEV